MKTLEKLKNMVSRYPFLNEIKSDHQEEREVTEEAIKLYHDKYEYLTDYSIHCFNHQRNQMTTSGAWLYNDKKESIDIVGDVLTAKSVFSFIEKNKENYNKNTIRLYRLFVSLYHSIGNFFPVGEGCNLPARPSGENYSLNQSSTDVFSKKLSWIKNIFEENVNNEKADEIIREIINNKGTLGRKPKKCCFHYWIQTEWKNRNKKWDDFVKENYLQEMIKNNSIVYYGPKEKSSELCWYLNEIEDESTISFVLAENIKIIIIRGYRVWNKKMEELSNKDRNLLENIFKELKIS